MATETLIIVVGGDYLAFEICREILKTAGHRVALVWKYDSAREERRLHQEARELAEDFGAAFSFVNEDATEAGMLERAGLRKKEGESRQGFCLVAVSQDDRLNLRIALAARDINDDVRITLRQFNPQLGFKIQEALKYNCTAISPAAHAAATYAAAAVDPSCSYALPFPTLETTVARVARRHQGNIDASAEVTKLYGFSQRQARDFDVAGRTVDQAEAQLRARVVSVNERMPYECRGDESIVAPDIARALQAEDRLVVFGAVEDLKDTSPDPGVETRRYGFERIGGAWRDFALGLRRMEPILRTVLIASIVSYFAFVVYFGFTLRLTVPAAMYFVTTTMATVGYGDITPCHNCTRVINPATVVPLFVAIAMMLAGIASFAVITATITSGLNSAQARRLQGLRRIHRRGHVIVCGAGNVGSLVIDFLREMGEDVVVVERDPDALLVELARDRRIDLLTGDATNDETIGYCAPERAKSLVGVTNSDTANLEAALGARTRMRERATGALHVVLRIDDLAFGNSIARHFGIKSFSTTELTAPTIAGLARFESTRGRFDLFSQSDRPRPFQLAERIQGPDNTPPPAPPERPGYRVQWIPLFVWRDDGSGRGSAHPIRNFKDGVKPNDRMLFLVPLDQFVDASKGD